MSIETFVYEIENRKKSDLQRLDSELAQKKAQILTERDATLAEIKERYAREAKAKSERESARIIEASRLQAKKILFDAINSNLESAMHVITDELKNFTKSSEYRKVLEAMISSAKKKLGPDIVIRCREQDRPILKDLGITMGPAIQTIGGILAENKEGTKELDLTFEELLRNNEDQIKGSLVEKML
jgi:V/A-type H+-transporting ATPase subunit E